MLRTAIPLLLLLSSALVTTAGADHGGADHVVGPTCDAVGDALTCDTQGNVTACAGDAACTRTRRDQGALWRASVCADVCVDVDANRTLYDATFVPYAVCASEPPGYNMCSVDREEMHEGVTVLVDWLTRTW